MYLIARNMVQHIEYYHVESHEVIRFGEDSMFLSNPEMNCNMKRMTWLNDKIVKVERIL